MRTVRDLWFYRQNLWFKGLRSPWKLPFDYINFRRKTGGSAHRYEGHRWPF